MWRRTRRRARLDGGETFSPELPAGTRHPTSLSGGDFLVRKMWRISALGGVLYRD